MHEMHEFFIVILALISSACLGELTTATLNISVNVLNSSGIPRVEMLSFPLADPDIELRLGKFCDTNSITHYRCRELYDVVMSRLQAQLDSELRHTYINAQYDPVTSSLKTPPNSHWDRHPTAVDNEARSSITTEDMESMISSEQAAVQYLLSNSSILTSSRIIFIHSCILSNQTPQVLINLLTKIRMIPDLWAPIIILHYGLPLTVSVPAHDRLSVYYYHVSHQTKFFEIPTLRIIHQFTQSLPSSSSNTPHVLYLHTKGISYESIPPEISDWVDMMLYFLLERHTSCKALLDSQDFDVIGCNYHTFPRALSGNFWWATASYLRALSRLSLREDKYAPERWVLSMANNQAIRVYVPHSSHFQHSQRRYPRYCYAPLPSTAVEGRRREEEVPSWREWSDVCGNENEEDYISLHHREGGYDRRSRAKMSMKPVGLVLYNP